jgi:DNA polymerase-3 subunit delta
MFFFFYGEDAFSIHEKVGALKEQFITKSDTPPEMVILRGSELTRAKYDEAIFSVSFFVSKKIVEVRNFLLESKDQNVREHLLKSLERIPASTLALFVEYGMPDARTSLFKALKIPKKSQHFAPLDPRNLSTWIEERVKSLGLKASSAVISKLGQYVGPDLWRLFNEIEKLAQYARSQDRDEIIPEDIDLMVQAEIKDTSFEFTDAVAARNKKRACQILYNLKGNGTNEILILALIVYQYRTMLTVLDLLNRGVPAGQIASQAKIHPFVAKKTISALRNYTFRELAQIYEQLYECDSGIKNGRIEPELALDLLVVDICKR